MSTLKFGYWKIRGLAAPIRMLLTFTGEKYEETLYEAGDGPTFDISSWKNVKYALGMPFPNLPYLFDGDFKLSQSIVISRYVAKKHGLAGSTEEEMAIVDMLAAVIDDFRGPISGSCYMPNFSELRVQKTEFIQRNLKSFEDFLSGDYLMGSSITFVDFMLYEIVDLAKVYLEGCLADKPKLTAYMERIRALPQLESYFSSEAASWPFNNTMAYFGGGYRK